MKQRYRRQRRRPAVLFSPLPVEGAARAPAPADETATSKAAPTASGTVTSATPLRRAFGARESSAGSASSDAVAEAAPSTGDTTATDASVERAARKLTLEESSAGAAPSDVAAEAFPLDVCYYNSSWPTHGSNSSRSNSSNSSDNGSSSSSNDTPSTTTHGGKPPMLEHYCDPLIRGKDAGGVRG